MQTAHLIVFQSEEDDAIIQIESMNLFESEAKQLNQFLIGISRYFNDCCFRSRNVYYACLPAFSEWSVRKNNSGAIRTFPNNGCNIFSLSTQRYSIELYNEIIKEGTLPAISKGRCHIGQNLHFMLVIDFFDRLLQLVNPSLNETSYKLCIEHCTSVFTTACLNKYYAARIPEFMYPFFRKHFGEYIDMDLYYSKVTAHIMKK